MYRRYVWLIQLAVLALSCTTVAHASDDVRTLDIPFESLGVQLAGSLVLPWRPPRARATTIWKSRSPLPQTG
jgi:hypothetical protein